MSPPRILFLGSPEFAVPTLRALLAHSELCEVVGAVSQPDRPAGRGRKLQAPPVKELAIAHGVAVLQPRKMKAPETRDAFAALAPELAIVAAYGRILPPALLEVPRLGCVNVHASLLPRHRGASPIAHAILAGDAETGISIMRMDAGLDTGPVLRQRALRIASTATCGSLSAQLAELGAPLLVETLPDILAGTAKATEQDAAKATYAPLLKKEDGALDFRKPAVELERRVRGLDPWPGTYAYKHGERIGVLAAHVTEHDMAASPPGTVLAAGNDGVTVACGEQALCIDRVKPAGRKAMTAGAWAHGRGVQAGDTLDAVPPGAA